MEDTLREYWAKRENDINLCLNPCSNGRYSQSWSSNADNMSVFVLILVLMEDTLRVINHLINIKMSES